jgi:hypothetical protein
MILFKDQFLDLKQKPFAFHELKSLIYMKIQHIKVFQFP